MESSLSILKKYWRHSQFRPLQQEIIDAVLAGNDTLALLPTGGGKSVCFQVPAMMLDGLCIVVSPLIALMKDQVGNLKSKGIYALAVHSGMDRQEIDVHLNNCIYGKVKFLYLSPERLQTEIFQERVKQMKVSLIAVDEAHCISQWGYDFRPPYLKLAALREVLPQVPVLALTATATPQVSDDIIDKLTFRSGYRIFRKTFARDNLSFVVRKTDNKERKLIEVLQKVKGSVIIYARSRKATHETAESLARIGIASTFYHAGLSHEQRALHQDEWIKNKARVMVATNAFGMGIDKPDVRTVVHLDIPETLESYYQEAGRAGRDGQRSYAVIIYNDADISSLEVKTAQAHPSIDFLKEVYQSLANYYQLALGSSEGESYDFELHDFCERYSLHMPEVYNALKKLEEEGVVSFNESFYSPSLLYLSTDKSRLYEFQVANERFDPLIKMLLRLYGGQLYDDFIKISERYLASALKISVEEMISLLKHLHELQVLVYRPAKESPQLTFILPRQDVSRLPLNVKRIEQRKNLAEAKMNSMITFTTSAHRCRMQLVQEYFGETTDNTCGKCDVCIDRKKSENIFEIKELRKEVLTLLKGKLYTLEQLEKRINPRDSELFVEVIREMVDDGVVEYDSVWRLKINVDQNP